MRRAVTLASFLMLGVAAAAQADDQRDRSPRPPDIASTAGILAKADSGAAGGFSAVQAIALIQQAGYADIGELERVNDFVWRGTAYKDGQTYSVAVDYTGTVVGAGN